jgi:uncharacterized protein
VKLHLLALVAIALAAAGCERAAPDPAPRASPTVSVGDLKLRPARVVDAAGLIPAPLEQRLSERLATLEHSTTNQFVVVTLPSLEGRTIEETGVRLGNGWGIGQADKDNGVLLIVAPNERKVRIEVGYGLERVLTDELCAQIIQNELLPSFRDDKLEAGIEKGVDKVIAILESSAAAGKQAA